MGAFICPCCGAHLDSMSEKCDCGGVPPPIAAIPITEPMDAVEQAWEEYYAN